MTISWGSTPGEEVSDGRGERDGERLAHRDIHTDSELRFMFISRLGTVSVVLLWSHVNV